MLESIGLTSVDDLFSQVPLAARMRVLDLPDAISEMETQKNIKKLANKNNTDFVSFLGGGVYNKFIPACISQIAQRFEFLTAYTPYQAEISQGTLQIMYEFQTMVARLTGMDISNATVYDGGTACAEAILMARRISKKTKGQGSRKVYVYDLKGNLIDECCSTLEAEKKYGIYDGGVSRVCRGQKNTVKNLVFSYSPNFEVREYVIKKANGYDRVFYK